MRRPSVRSFLRFSRRYGEQYPVLEITDALFFSALLAVILWLV